jgi:hypothetical protein
MRKVVGVWILIGLAGCAHRPVPCEAHLQPINGWVHEPAALELPRVQVAPPTLTEPAGARR